VRTAATSIEDGGATFDWVGAADADADADGAEGEAPEVEGAAVCPGAAPDAGGAGAACAAAGWWKIADMMFPKMLIFFAPWVDNSVIGCRVPAWQAKGFCARLLALL